jgi:hypothetical protein
VFAHRILLCYAGRAYSRPAFLCSAGNRKQIVAGIPLA